MNKRHLPGPTTSKPIRHGKASGSMIRLGVLFLVLIGVGIFGWLRRPDLVRNYLGVNAPAWNTTQALQFANAELFSLATELTEAEVVFLDQGRERLMAMIETGGGDQTVSAETIRNDPNAFGERCIRKLEQVQKDANRAKAVLDAKTFRTSGDQSSLWKTLDLAKQVQRAIGVLGKSDLGETFKKLDADKAIGDIVGDLTEIQWATSPNQRTVDPNAAPILPNEMSWSRDSGDDDMKDEPAPQDDK